MNYKQFVSAVEEKVRQQVKAGTSVYLHTALKNNGKNRIGVTIAEEGVNISPTIYLEEYFEQFQKYKSLDSVVKSILKVYQEVRMERSWEVGILRDYENIRRKIAYKLIYAEENETLLENVPHILYMDLALVFYVILELNPAGTATVLITDDILKMWHVRKEDVLQEAKRNTPKLLTAEFRTMRSVVDELLGGDDEEDRDEREDCMYVLTNHIRSFGAACILYDNVLEDIGNQLGENFYVLPSSVHEVIIVPESKSPNRAELEEMIEEINDTQVEDEEILSYSAYYFSRKENRLIF